jgi:hypothetical protein
MMPYRPGVSQQWSLVERLGGRLVGVRFQQRLLRRFATPQAVEADLAFGEIDPGADQTMRPQLRLH